VPDNLLEDLPASLPEELFTALVERNGVKIERIVSTGQATPAGRPYDQAWDEWVVLLAGSAGLWVEGAGERRLAPGDHVFLPAHTRHRVTFTDPDQPTVWLAVHIGLPE